MPANSRAFAMTFPHVYVACHIEGPGHEILGADQIQSFQIARELVGNNLVLAEDALDRDREESPGSGAFAWEAMRIPNGTFSLTAPGYGTIDIQIHTVQRGTLRGRRVVKVRDEDGPGGWRAIAFVSRQGQFQLWTRYLSRAENPEVIAARAVVEALHFSRGESGTFNMPSRTMASVPVEAQISVVRRACLIDNQPVDSETIQIGTRARDRNPGLCDDHIPAMNEARRTIPRVDRNEEMARITSEAPATPQRASRGRSEAVYGDESFSVRRHSALLLCENGTGEIR